MNTALVTLVTLECWYRTGTEVCGRLFGITPRTERWMSEEGGTVYCPAGHRIRYGNGELHDLRDKLAREQSQHDQTKADRDAARARADHEERRARTLKGHHTRLKKRVAAGVCPCCKRTFQNVARHMRGQHPRFSGSMA